MGGRLCSSRYITHPAGHKGTKSVSLASSEARSSHREVSRAG